MVHPANDTGRKQTAPSQVSGRSQGPSSMDWSGGAVPKSDSMVPPTKDTTMSLVSIAVPEQLPSSPPKLAQADLDELMSETANDGTHKMDTADHILTWLTDTPGVGLCIFTCRVNITFSRIYLFIT